MKQGMLERIFWSLLLIGIGVGLILNNFQILRFDVGDFIRRFWPALLILVGGKMIVEALLRARKTGGWFFSSLIGFVLIVVGWNLIAEEIGFQEIEWSMLWGLIGPIILIYIGLSLLMGDKWKRKGKKNPYWEKGTDMPPKTDRGYDTRDEFYPEREHDEEEEKIATGRKKTGETGSKWRDFFESEGYYTEGKNRKRKFYKSSFIGEIKLGKNLFELEDLSIWNGIGDISIDFSKAIMAEGETEVEIRGLIGDVKLYIPREIPVEINANVWIGEYRIFDEHENGWGKGYTYKSPDYEIAPRKLRLIIDYKIGDIRILDI